MNTGNRLLWVAIGAVLTALGVLGVLASLGKAGLDRNRLLLGTDAAQRWNSWGGWATAVTIVGGLLIALLGFLLLRAQIRGRGGAAISDLVLPAEHTAPDDRREPETVEATAESPEASTMEITRTLPPVPGRTHVTSRALHRALAQDLQGELYVRRAAVRLVGDRERPEVQVRLAVTADADVVRLRRHVDVALERFAVTSGVHPHLHDVVLTMADQAPEPRVH